PLIAFYERRTLALADHIIAVSKYIGEVTLKAAKLEERSWAVLHNPLNTDIFKPNSSAVRDSKRILFVGRLSETKGAPNLFKAIPLIFRRFPEVYLRFIG